MFHLYRNHSSKSVCSLLYVTVPVNLQLLPCHLDQASSLSRTGLNSIPLQFHSYVVTTLQGLHFPGAQWLLCSKVALIWDCHTSLRKTVCCCKQSRKILDIKCWWNFFLPGNWNECQLFKNLTDQLKLILVCSLLIAMLNIIERIFSPVSMIAK